MNAKKMLTIDLLKGQGIPERSNPDKIALTAITIVVPFFIGLTLLNIYSKNSVLLSIQRQNIENCEKGMNKLSEAQNLLNRSEKEKKYRDDCLAEVAKTINKSYQWTPALIEIVKLLPDSVVLSGVDVKQGTIKKTVPSKQGGSDIEVTIPVTKLKICVTEKSSLSRSQNIREFQEQLRSSDFFKPLLDTITVSQGIDNYKEVSNVTYQIECNFKQQSKL
ncbi:MAG: hypothetical protein ABFD79_18560 [Phycisphaerales bacterium]